jgi:hypothetical protein
VIACPLWANSDIAHFNFGCLIANLTRFAIGNIAQKNRACVRYDADPLFATRVIERMATVIYRCPNTGFRVQGYTVDETVRSDQDSYEPVTCLACKLMHLVNPKSGEVFVAGERK